MSRKLRMHCPHAILFVVLIPTLALNSCAPSRRGGPKLIEADGKKYIACQGAVWTTNDGNEKDPATKSLDVLFKDAQGSTRHLAMAHSLQITDLPSRYPLPPSS